MRQSRNIVFAFLALVILLGAASDDPVIVYRFGVPIYIRQQPSEVQKTVREMEQKIPREVLSAAEVSGDGPPYVNYLQGASSGRNGSSPNHAPPKEVAGGSNGRFRVEVTPKGGYRLTSKDGQGTVIFGSSSLSERSASFTASILRSLVTSFESTPWRDTGARSQVVSASTQASLQAYQDHLNFLQTTHQNIFDAQTEFVREHAAVAGTRYLNEVLPQYQETASQRFGVIQGEGQEVMPAIPSSPQSPATRGSLGSEALQRKIAALERSAGDPLAIWNELAPIWRSRHFSEESPSPWDNVTEQEIYDRYVDANGIVGAAVVGQENEGQVAAVSREVTSDINSGIGKRVRLKINETLARMYTKRLIYESIMKGALMMFLSSDGAAGGGKKDLSELLYAHGLKCLSLSPAAAVVDGGHVVSGMATGYNLNGERMGTSDYVVHSAITVASIFGVSKIIKVGKTAITPAFIKGSEVLRRLRLGEYLYERAGRSKQVIIEVTEWVGKKIGIGGGTIDPSELDAVAKQAQKAVTGATSELRTFTSDRIKAVIESSARPNSNQIAEGARAIAKKLGHAIAERRPTAFEGLKVKQEVAEKLIDEIMKNPVHVIEAKGALEVYNAAGQGVNFDAVTNRFIGFVERTWVK